MKAIILTLAILFSAGVVNAEPVKVSEIIDKFPPLKSGVAFSLIDNKLNYLQTIEVATWKGFALEAGYAGRAKQTGDKAVAVLSYNLPSLEHLGIKVPLAKYIDVNVGVYAGYGRIDLTDGTGESNNEFDAGLSATLISIKF